MTDRYPYYTLCKDKSFGKEVADGTGNDHEQGAGHDSKDRAGFPETRFRGQDRVRPDDGRGSLDPAGFEEGRRRVRPAAQGRAASSIDGGDGRGHHPAPEGQGRMKALDTNVLVRFLTRDDPAQAETVYRVFKQAEGERTRFWIPVAVVLETVWVLESVYGVSRKGILEALDDLLLMPILKFESHDAVQTFTAAARQNRTDLSDLLIAHCARQAGCENVLSFDRKAARSELFEPMRG